MHEDEYQNSARFYDRFIEPMNTGLRAVGLKMAAAVAGTRVLDVGCGTGTHLGLYLDGCCKVYGIDSSPAMLKEAKHKLGDGAELILADATAMPYGDASFDLVMMTLILHEISPEARMGILSEVKRVLKKDGRILIIDYHPGPIKPLGGWLKKSMIYCIEFIAGKEHFTNYRQFIRAGGIPALASENDLSIEQQKLVAGANVGIFLMGMNR